MIKVVHLVRSFWPNIGGVETHLLHLSSELTKHQIHQTIICEQHNSNLSSKTKIDSLNIIRINTLNNQSDWKYKLRVWHGIFRDFSVLLNAEIIHVHDVFWWLLPFWPILIILRKKIFITFHGYEGDNPPNKSQVFWHQVAARMTNGNICVGGFHQRWYHVKPNFVTYGAVDLTTISKQKKLLNHNHKILAIHLGRLANDNGILEYLKAIQILQKRNVRIHLDSFGDGPLRQKCQKFVNEHHLDVTFHGFVPRDEIKLHQYDIAFVSRYLVILEALAANILVIAQYNNQIKHDYLSLSPFAKWIVIESDPEKIVQAVLSKSKVYVEAKKWARSQTWENMVELYLKLWQIKK